MDSLKPWILRWISVQREKCFYDLSPVTVQGKKLQLTDFLTYRKHGADDVVWAEVSDSEYRVPARFSKPSIGAFERRGHSITRLRGGIFLIKAFAARAEQPAGKGGLSLVILIQDFQYVGSAGEPTFGAPQSIMSVDWMMDYIGNCWRLLWRGVDKQSLLAGTSPDPVPPSKREAPKSEALQRQSSNAATGSLPGVTPELDGRSSSSRKRARTSVKSDPTPPPAVIPQSASPPSPPPTATTTAQPPSAVLPAPTQHLELTRASADVSAQRPRDATTDPQPVEEKPEANGKGEPHRGKKRKNASERDPLRHAKWPKNFDLSDATCTIPAAQQALLDVIKGFEEIMYEVEKPADLVKAATTHGGNRRKKQAEPAVPSAGPSKSVAPPLVPDSAGRSPSPSAVPAPAPVSALAPTPADIPCDIPSVALTERAAPIEESEDDMPVREPRSGAAARAPPPTPPSPRLPSPPKNNIPFLSQLSHERSSSAVPTSSPSRRAPEEEEDDGLSEYERAHPNQRFSSPSAAPTSSPLRAAIREQADEHEEEGDREDEDEDERDLAETVPRRAFKPILPSPPRQPTEERTASVIYAVDSDVTLSTQSTAPHPSQSHAASAGSGSAGAAGAGTLPSQVPATSAGQSSPAVLAPSSSAPAVKSSPAPAVPLSSGPLRSRSLHAHFSAPVLVTPFAAPARPGLLPSPKSSPTPALEAKVKAEEPEVAVGGERQEKDARSDEDDQISEDLEFSRPPSPFIQAGLLLADERATDVPADATDEAPVAVAPAADDPSPAPPDTAPADSPPAPAVTSAGPTPKAVSPPPTATPPAKSQHHAHHPLAAPPSAPAPPLTDAVIERSRRRSTSTTLARVVSSDKPRSASPSPPSPAQATRTLANAISTACGPPARASLVPAFPFTTTASPAHALHSPAPTAAPPAAPAPPASSCRGAIPWWEPSPFPTKANGRVALDWADLKRILSSVKEARRKGLSGAGDE